jgi:branched-subunit amino acid transport protein
LLLSGIVAAIVTAPIFDRVLTSHLAITTKILVPVLAAAWLSLVWAGRSRTLPNERFLNPNL